MKDAIKFFKALSDPTRLRILLLLLKRDLCVCEMMFVLKMEQSRVSHQLRILRDADLVEDVREGRWMTYRIPTPARKNVVLLVENFLGGKIGDSKEIHKDMDNLELCVKEEIRTKHQVFEA